jgi:hypothetical protein
MGTNSIANATVTCFVATLLVIGFTAAPVAAADGTGISFGDDGVSISVGDDVSVDAGQDGVNVSEDVDDEDTDPDSKTPEVDDPTQGDDEEDDGEEGPFPEQVCTDVTGEVHDSAPYEQVPWFDDLPEEAQPPGVPTSVITPEAVAGIVFGVTPNQCEVQDPNDPSYDPREDDVDPDADANLAQFGPDDGGFETVVTYDVTLNESGEGPGSSGVIYVVDNPEFGDNGADIAVNDGEKDYAVQPRVRYWDGGNVSYAKNDVWLLGSRLGVDVDCDGEECQPGTGGLPHYADYPAVPDPVGGDGGGGESPLCTDVTGEVHDSAPYEQVPWFDDLPEEAQPPGVPTSVITPEAVAGIVFGVTPNQCEVQDPNDPSYDPREDDVDPDADANLAQFGPDDGGFETVVTYDVTLNESGEGPGSSGVIYVVDNPEFGDNGADIAVNDGEKDYAVQPRVRYWDGGNVSYAKNDVWLLGSRLGVDVDCDGEECQPGTGGLPHYADYPAIPAPTGGD